MHLNVLNFTWLRFVFRQSQFHAESKTLTGVVEDRATQRILLLDMATNFIKFHTPQKLVYAVFQSIRSLTKILDMPK